MDDNSNSHTENVIIVEDSSGESEKFEDILEELKELNNNLKEPSNPEIIYHDNEKKKKKYVGEMKDGKYEGRGTFYDFSGKIEYDGYFKDGNYEGYGREYNFYDNKLKYEGFFSNYKYNGKGMLYYKNNKIFFVGYFKENDYVKGILYDPEGNIVYKGEFINKNPKEGKNIKLFELNGDLIYEGDFLEGKYHGQGTLYEIGKYERKGIFSEFKRKKYIGEFNNGNFEGTGKLYMDHSLGKYLYYEGKFKNGLFNDEGILFYQNGKKFYDGNFKDGQICGKGVRFYKNGSKKMEGVFENSNSCEGKYFNPEEKEIYSGKILNEIPLTSKNITIYDDNMNKIYEGETNEGVYEGEGTEYCSLIKDMVLYKGHFSKNYYIDSNENTEKNNEPKSICIIYKFNVIDAKNLINRFMGIEINTDNQKREYKFEYNKVNYVINFIEPSANFKINEINDCNIIFYLFDLNSDNQIKEKEFEEMIKLNQKKALIYLIGNNLNLLENADITKENLNEYRKQAEKLISDKKVNKYFEISIETGKGIENLKKNVEIDTALNVQSSNTASNGYYSWNILNYLWNPCNIY